MPPTWTKFSNNWLVVPPVHPINRTAYETIYRFCQKRIPPYPARPTDDAYPYRNAHRANHPVRIRHIHGSEERADSHPFIVRKPGHSSYYRSSGCQRVLHREIYRSHERGTEPPLPQRKDRIGNCFSSGPAKATIRF